MSEITDAELSEWEESISVDMDKANGLYPHGVLRLIAALRQAREGEDNWRDTAMAGLAAAYGFPFPFSDEQGAVIERDYAEKGHKMGMDAIRALRADLDAANRALKSCHLLAAHAEASDITPIEALESILAQTRKHFPQEGGQDDE